MKQNKKKTRELDSEHLLLLGVELADRRNKLHVPVFEESASDHVGENEVHPGESSANLFGHNLDAGSCT